MLVITMACGLAAAAIGGAAYASLGPGGDIGFARLGNFLMGAIAGYVVGVIIGIWLAARLLRRPGISWRASLGAVLGVAVVMALVEPLRINANQGLLLALLLVVPALCALIGHQVKFNRGRRS